MSDFDEMTGDEMVKVQITEKSNTLNIPINRLITRYIMRGLYIDDYYDPPQLTDEEFF